MQNAKCKIADETVTIYKKQGTVRAVPFLLPPSFFRGKKSTSLGEGGTTRAPSLRELADRRSD